MILTKKIKISINSLKITVLFQTTFKLLLILKSEFLIVLVLKFFKTTLKCKKEKPKFKMVGIERK